MHPLLTILETGAWFTIANLAERLRVPRRDVEQWIEDLRLNGEPIVGGRYGVRWSHDPTEVRQYAQGRRRRLVSIARGTRRLLHTANAMEAPQREFWT